MLSLFLVVDIKASQQLQQNLPVQSSKENWLIIDSLCQFSLYYSKDVNNSAMTFSDLNSARISSIATVFLPKMVFL